MWLFHTLNPNFVDEVTDKRGGKRKRIMKEGKGQEMVKEENNKGE
jgi:hypothetical protein